MHEVDSSDNSEYYTGQLLKELMLNLGPTFIKVGQSLSTRPDIIGSEISKALSELHDKIPPFPREVAIKIIEEEFGCPVEKVFSFISEEPVAAASFGQVYQGSTLDGSTVAIKVQRPDMLHAVVLDVYILRLGVDKHVQREIMNHRSLRHPNIVRFKEARFFFQQLISGVSYCHSMQICHRDLKLENTLLDGSTAPRLKICDFGIR